MMFKALIYKEWLKIKWSYLISFILGILALTEIYLLLNQMIEFNKAENVWGYIIIKKYLFYDLFRYLPLAAGAAVAVFQFFPEVQEKRLKLTLHLPVKENKAMLLMTSIGFVFLGVMFLTLTGMLALVSSWFFPFEIIVSVINTTLPWMLAGLALYFIVSFIFVEPLWVRKILFGVVGYGFINLLLFDYGYNAYIYSIPLFALFTLLTGTLIIISGYRFKRGTR